MSSKLPIKGGKVLLDFKILQFIDGMHDETTGEQTAPPHWRLQDPVGGVIAWGPLETFDAIVAIMRIAKLGAKHASQDELVNEGIIIRQKPKLWTPDDGGDNTMATHIGETGGFVGGERIAQDS